MMVKIMTEKTIYALASGKGRAGIAIIRISGTETSNIIKILSLANLPKARFAKYLSIYDPKTKDLLDDCILLWFPAPNSYTGEDVAEFHIHGGVAVINSFMAVLNGLDNVRLALPGEFTKRAFLNDKMDLTKAEGLIDLINAETEAQKKQAQRQSQGALGKLYISWMNKIIPLLAYYEAEIDFSDEELPKELGQRNKEKINQINDEIALHLNDNNRGERLRDGVHIAIIGQPNVGKSSLLNSLAKRDVAIVSDIAGTTRDILEVHLDLNGYPVTLYDTAGIHETVGIIENEGIRRALKIADNADLKIIMLDNITLNWQNELTKYNDNNSIFLLNKIDINKINNEIFNQIKNFGIVIFCLSVKSGSGISSFLNSLGDRIEKEFGLSETPAITRNRHREAVIDANAALNRALIAPEIALAAEDLRMAVRALGSITGQVDVEDLLDIIFSEFCIGK